jgi:lipopolysaccharide assembly protein A
VSTEPQPTQTPASAPQSWPAESRSVADPQLDAPPPGSSAQQQPPLPPPGPPQQQQPPLPQHKIRHTRISGLWFAVAFFAVVLLFLLIFILQNGKAADISYLGMHGHLPLGVALLLAAVCGVLLVVLAGAARISQLRAVARRHRRADAKRVAASPAAGEPARPAR